MSSYPRFELEPQEVRKLREWQNKKDLMAYAGAIGGRFTYHFTPTSLGLIVKVSDNIDGDEIDLTDYKSW